MCYLPSTVREVEGLKAYEKLKIKKILNKLNELVEALDEGDYWLDPNFEDQEEIEFEDWWGDDEHHWFVDEVSSELCILQVCRYCGRTIQKTCKNCS